MASALAYEKTSELLKLLKSAGLSAEDAARVLLKGGLGKFVRDGFADGYKQGWEDAMRFVAKTGGAV